MSIVIEMYCIVLIISSIVFSAVDDFNLKNNLNLKSKTKNNNTMKERTL